jgi:cell division protease FtsH
LNSTLRSLVFWIVLILVAGLVWKFSTGGFPPGYKTESFTEFKAQLDANKVDRATITAFPNGAGADIEYVDKGGLMFRTVAPASYDVTSELLRASVKVTAKEPAGNLWTNFLVGWLPFLLVLGFWLFFMRQMQSGGNKALSFGKSKAKLSSSAQKKVTFKDVAGVDEAKDELQEIIDFLREPQKFQKLGGRIPKGVLLMGPPGTGKTLLARAVAGEANVPFFSISGSDFVEMFVGVGASRVRDLFEQGKKNAPCIVFIDEIDAVGRHRGAGLGGGHDEREQTLNQLLVEMDGFESNEGVILVAATNRPDVLDPALLRPGRFDRRIVVNRPDVKGREGILAVHTKKIPMADDVDVAVLARGSSGFSGADLANLVNEAALNAARYNQKVVRMLDFEFAKDKVLMGAERRSMIITENEKRVTAIHEAGHALLAVLLPHAEPIHKVSIIPRGMALGITMQLPADEKHNYSREHLEDQIAILLGGRIAEEITLDSITTGAGNDLERATELARRMVCEWGMSRAMGPLTFGKKEEQIFLGREIAQHQDYSEDTALRIDQEVKRFVTDNYAKAQAILSEHKQHLVDLADALLQRETLDAEQVKRLAAGLRLEEPAPAPSQAAPPRVAQPAKERPAASIVPPLPPRPLTQE